MRPVIYLLCISFLYNTPLLASDQDQFTKVLTDFLNGHSLDVNQLSRECRLPSPEGFQKDIVNFKKCSDIFNHKDYEILMNKVGSIIREQTAPKDFQYKGKSVKIQAKIVAFKFNKKTHILTDELKNHFSSIETANKLGPQIMSKIVDNFLCWNEDSLISMLFIEK